VSTNGPEGGGGGAFASGNPGLAMKYVCSGSGLGLRRL